jgi:MFS family permease
LTNPFAKALESRIPARDFMPAFILVSNSLTWYTLAYVAFNNAINKLSISGAENLVYFIFYYAGIACSAILGSMFFPRARKSCLLSWILAGTVMTVLLITIPNNSAPVNVLVSLSLGVSIGVGLPSCLAYFADVTLVENRGVYGGISWAAVGFEILILAFVINALDVVLAIVVLAVWRVLSIVAFLFKENKEKARVAHGPSSYGSILRRRDVLLYVAPWIMFSLVNFSEVPMLQRLFGDFSNFVAFVEFAISGVFALVGGFLADLFGRKRVIITGFVALGIEYAALSIFSPMIVSWYLYVAFDGIAWGMFAAVFFMTLWGDLAEDCEKDKYYALGGLPYLLAGFLPIIIKPYADAIQTTAAFSIASFFLFLAVIPLMYAPETLPEKKMKDRELRDYVEKAKKAKQKYT